jgi:organic radical activating enzyme
MTIKIGTEIGKNFCYAPWTNIHINTQGIYKTCCAGSQSLANLQETSIDAAQTSSTLTEIKKKLLHNQYHDNCQACVRQEGNSHSSERTWYNSFANNNTIELELVTDSHIQNLDIRWSNTCNLNCVYCGAYSSSQWAQLQKIPIERLDYDQTLEGIIKFIDRHRSTLKNVSLLGGEPLLQKQNDLLLDVIPDSVSVYVITNLNVPLDSNRVFQKLIARNNVTWDISFETVEDRFEYVRHGSSWDLMLKNIKLLRQVVNEKSGQAMATAAIYSVYNAMNLCELYKKFELYQLPKIRWSEMYNPEILSVSALPRRFIDRAIKELEICYDQNNTLFLKQMADSLKKVNNTTANCDALYSWHRTQEQTYWPNFKHTFESLWPEYRDL